MMTRAQRNPRSTARMPRAFLSIPYVMRAYVLCMLAHISYFQLVSVLEDKETEGDHKATGSCGINRRTNAASSGQRRKLIAQVPDIARRVSEASCTSSPPTSAESGSKKIDELPLFAKVEWPKSFLPTLYTCLGSSENPWQLQDQEFIILVQDIVDIVYPNSRYEVVAKGPIYKKVRTGLTAL